MDQEEQEKNKKRKKGGRRLWPNSNAQLKKAREEREKKEEQKKNKHTETASDRVSRNASHRIPAALCAHPRRTVHNGPSPHCAQKTF